MASKVAVGSSVSKPTHFRLRVRMLTQWTIVIMTANTQLAISKFTMYVHIPPGT